jgi:hypothetical protein
MGYPDDGKDSDKPGTAPAERQDRKPPTGPEAGPEKTSGEPAAGPHADPALVNPDATPGAGTLPPPGAENDDVDATSG